MFKKIINMFSNTKQCNERYLADKSLEIQKMYNSIVAELPTEHITKQVINIATELGTLEKSEENLNKLEMIAKIVLEIETLTRYPELGKDWLECIEFIENETDMNYHTKDAFMVMLRKEYLGGLYEA